MIANSEATHLDATRAAFDAVAAEYDGTLGNNVAIQAMRRTLWQRMERTFPPGSRLLDLGCGNGIDAVHMAQRGYHVMAIDQSSGMVAEARLRAERNGVAGQVQIEHIGIQDLTALRGERFDGIYSNLGALNCVPDLTALSAACASFLPPGAPLFASVIGKWCPWEIAFYALRGDLKRATIRFRSSPAAVLLEGGTIWTWYYTPQAFYRPFAGDFDLIESRGLLIVSPPPYIAPERQHFRGPVASRVDGWIGSLPGLRQLGDHFCVTLRRWEPLS